MKTKEQLEILFDECLTRLLDARESMKENYPKRKRRSKMFNKHWYATQYIGMEDWHIQYAIWKRDITKLNHLRQALWNHGVYKQLIR